jgi:hypothetical protein
VRKLKLVEHISLDGVIQHSADDGDFPYNDWTAPYRGQAGSVMVHDYRHHTPRQVGLTSACSRQAHPS